MTEETSSSLKAFVHNSNSYPFASDTDSNRHSNPLDDDDIATPSPPSSSSPIFRRLQNLAVIFLIVSLTVGEAEFTQRTVDITGALFLAWLASVAGLLSYPIWASLQLCGASQPISYSAALRADGISWRTMLVFSSIVSLSQTLCVYCYMASLHRTTAEDMITLYNTSSVFIYLAGLLFLDDKPDFWKFLAVLWSLGGAVYVSYGGFPSSSSSSSHNHAIQETFLVGQRWQGDLLALGSALLATFDLIYTKKVLGDDASVATCNLVMVLTGLSALLMQWPLLLLFHYTGIEPFHVPSSASGWGWVCGSVLMAFCINWLFTIGVVFMDPLYVTIAGFLAMPISALFDWVLHGVPFTWIEAIGTVLVIVGFTMLSYDVHAFVSKHCFAPSSIIVNSTTSDDDDDSVHSSSSSSNFLPTNREYLSLQHVDF